jgi:outer membrane protein OmpA-like peptidoglycan-associated protein
MKLLTFLLLNIFCFNVVSLCGQENDTSSNLESVQLKKPIQIELLVFDKETKNPIPNAKVTFTKSDGSEVIGNTDNSGKVIFENVISNDTSLSHRKFSYAVYQKEYFIAKHESTYSKETINFKDTVFLEFALGKTFKAPEVIFWDSRLFVDEYNNSYDSIMKLHKLLTDNQTMVIELQFNTDCRGSAKYNEKLTQKRAEGVKSYLIDKGIESERIIAKGNGLSNPLPSLDCESIKKMKTQEEQEIAHLQNRRTEFKVLSFDFKPLPENQIFSVYQEIIVLDKETGTPIENAGIRVFASGKGNKETFNEFVFSSKGGKAILDKVLSRDSSLSEWNFSYIVSKDGYLAVRKDIILSKGKNSFTDTLYLLNVTNKLLDLPQIWFAYDKKDLLVQEGRINSCDSLDYLYQILIDNPSLIVEIQVHSDCRGSNKYSRILTQIRAQSCAEYLISKGISKERLVAKGYEGTVPREPGLDCESINKMSSKEEQELAHQKNRRVQFKVLSFDYVPKVEYEFD